MNRIMNLSYIIRNSYIYIVCKLVLSSYFFIFSPCEWQFYISLIFYIFFYAYSHILNIQIDDKLVKFTDTSILKFYIFLYINNTLIVGRLRIGGFSHAWADCEPIYRHLSSILQIFFQGQKWLRCSKKFGVFCLFF